MNVIRRQTIKIGRTRNCPRHSALLDFSVEELVCWEVVGSVDDLVAVVVVVVIVVGVVVISVVDPL